MKQGTSKTFRAVLESSGTTPRWVIARIPVDLKKAWPEWRNRRVRGQINGFAFQTSLIPGPKGSGLMLIVNKRMQAGAKTRPGDTVRIRMEPDLEPRSFALPKELVSVLNGERLLRKWFDRLSPSLQRGISQFVDQAKTSNTRGMRTEKMAESMLLAMEGETEPPPLLRVAFARRPGAQAGWNAMTPIQRRNHLFGIFYQQTVQARERRAAQAVEECLRVAKRKGRLG